MKIIGTSHIAKQSIKEIKDTVEKEQPDILALELDSARLYSLTHPEQRRGLPPINRVGIQGFLFSILGQWAQKKLGHRVGVQPGAEMLTAIELAKEKDIQIALVDQDIQITLQRFSKALTWKEKLNIIKDIIRGFLFGEKELEKLGIKDMDLSKVPEKEVIKKLISELEERYPNIYRVLVEERNIVMARNLKRIQELNPDKKIVAIIGAGHEDEVRRLVKSD